MLRHEIEVEHFGPGTVFARIHPKGVLYCDPDMLPPPLDTQNQVGALDNGISYWLDWDLPLNGEWSDLTAQFEFIRTADGYRVCLHCLHVL